MPSVSVGEEMVADGLPERRRRISRLLVMVFSVADSDLKYRASEALHQMRELDDSGGATHFP